MICTELLSRRHTDLTACAQPSPVPSVRRPGSVLGSLLIESGTGSGAAFAFEDAYTLKSVIDFSNKRGRDLDYALEHFDSVRAPRYKELVCGQSAGCRSTC